ncbi:unnamed protein product [Staurois parvus]|uniref:Uncharacterized protein n=1 Tax=Staurois parvus TaxID=386267 RepID=A0ABN9F8E1_9NEOB|nr:unnamed protein product [Staurois parvus]
MTITLSVKVIGTSWSALSPKLLFFVVFYVRRRSTPSISCCSQTCPVFSLPEGLLCGDPYFDKLVKDCALYCQEQKFNPDEYSKAVRETKTDFAEECASPRKIRVCLQGFSAGSINYTREELSQGLQRLSLCVYSGTISNDTSPQDCREAQHQGLGSSSDNSDLDREYMTPDWVEHDFRTQEQLEIPYEELWTNQNVENYSEPSSKPVGLESGNKTQHDLISFATSPSPLEGKSCSPPPPALTIDEVKTEAPPPVPPKSEAVRQECRLLNAPPVPPRDGRLFSSSSSPPVPPRLPKAQLSQAQSPSLSYYSSGLHDISGNRSGSCSPSQIPIPYTATLVPGETARQEMHLTGRCPTAWPPLPSPRRHLGPILGPMRTPVQVWPAVALPLYSARTLPLRLTTAAPG